MGTHTSKLSNKEIAKISEKTLFSVEEIKAWHEGFLRDCPTGKLSRGEFLNIYNQCFPAGEPEEFARLEPEIETGSRKKLKFLESFSTFSMIMEMGRSNLKNF